MFGSPSIERGLASDTLRVPRCQTSMHYPTTQEHNSDTPLQRPMERTRPRVWRRSTRRAHPSARGQSGSVREIVRPNSSHLSPPSPCIRYHSRYTHVWKPDSMPCSLVYGNLQWRRLSKAKLLVVPTLLPAIYKSISYSPKVSSTSTAFPDSLYSHSFLLITFLRRSLV